MDLVRSVAEKIKMLRVHHILDTFLKDIFRSLGRFIGRHPIVFLIIPLIASCLLSTGMFQVTYISDADYLLTPTNGMGRKERALAEKYFPTNFSDFDATRSTKFGLYGYVMVTAKDGNSVLDPGVWSEVKSLQDVIVNLRVSHEGQEYQYEDICAKWNGQCYTNSLLSSIDPKKASKADINEAYCRDIDSFSWEFAKPERYSSNSGRSSGSVIVYFCLTFLVFYWDKRSF